jgi:uncharacterized integral membrane protein
MKRAKLIVISIISLLALVVSLQNTESVETRLLFATITMPRVLLLVVTLVTGFVVGLLSASHILGRFRKPGVQDQT